MQYLWKALSRGVYLHEILERRSLRLCPPLILIAILLYPVFSELWPWNQAAGSRLCLSKPIQNRGEALHAPSSAAHTEVMSGAEMPLVEGQQVDRGMCTLRPVTATRAAETQTQTSQKGRPRGCRCRTCTHRPPVQSCCGLF